jgi:hypothetical protein
MDSHGRVLADCSTVRTTLRPNGGRVRDRHPQLCITGGSMNADSGGRSRSSSGGNLGKVCSSARDPAGAEGLCGAFGTVGKVQDEAVKEIDDRRRSDRLEQDKIDSESGGSILLSGM